MTSPWDDAGGLTRDAFLGGRLRLDQPRRGYRAGIDPVLLAAFVPARAGDSVLELGCGGGAALLCLGARVGGLDLTGVEIQPHYAELARGNAALNGIAARIVTADLRALPPDLRQRRFDHVIANPPFFDRRQGTAARDSGRDTALAGDTPLADWIAAGSRRLAPRGWMTVIQRADRLADLLTPMAGDLGSIVVRPLCPRAGRDATLVVVQGRKGGRAPLRLAAPLILHYGPTHGQDAEDYTPKVYSALRCGEKLP
ncbi:N-6 Adenine-specific DNA methylase [Oceaniovalibus guishaninsula JLT2003]|uniref:N-6 Adenine-specific DNA methylase n=1 Tax=Oceaniovalibus guishaninsula JLT2003 TaxID=1231392 RepID=K2HMR8_9RHOB|nr:methyltransferase domain-containing protein [Oceaniovalibus guishaninsula]EKE44124.1 N-6 Adenine-specific DNA methylase [Oceaniovalibus guishaninsula JLT2003]